jgi:hypothetical protein
MDYLPTRIRSPWLAEAEAFSALPDAPVVPYVEPAPRLRRTRVTTAAVLYWLGDVLTPAKPVRSSRSLG